MGKKTTPHIAACLAAALVAIVIVAKFPFAARQAGQASPMNLPGETLAGFHAPRGVPPQPAHAREAVIGTVLQLQQRDGDPAQPGAGRVRELSGALDRLVLSGSKVQHEYLKILRALIDVGTPQATEVVIAAMENEALGCDSRAAMFSQVLTGVSHPEIQPAAMRVLDGSISTGEDSWYTTTGYIELIASTGGHTGAKKLLDLLETESTQVAAAAARGLAKLKGSAVAAQAMEVVHGENDYLGCEVARSLASWKDPAVTAELVRVASESSHSDLLRGQIYEAVGRNLQPQETAGFVSPYWNASASDRAQIIQGVYGVASNRDLTPEFKRSRLAQVLKHALGREDRSTYQPAMYAVEYNEAFHSHDMLEALRVLEIQTSGKDRKRDLARVIERIEKTIRGRSGQR